jgi:hypothetical protein
MEEYNLDICYIKGPENIVADILSRLSTTNDPEKPYIMPSQKKWLIVLAKTLKRTDCSPSVLP